MTRILLRWLGGQGGDTIVGLISFNKQVYSNIRVLNELSDTGQSMVETFLDQRYPSIKVIATKKSYKVDPDTVANDIKRLSDDHESFLLKSHLYDRRLDEKVCNIVHVIDIGYSLEFLPFVVRTNLAKTPTLERSTDPDTTHFDETLLKISHKLSDNQKQSLVKWNVVKHALEMHRRFDLGSKELNTQDIFYDTNKIIRFLESKGLTTVINKDHLDKWKEVNKKFLPSENYVGCIKNANYDFSDRSMDSTERYSLLALSGKNFQFLD